MKTLRLPLRAVRGEGMTDHCIRCGVDIDDGLHIGYDGPFCEPCWYSLGGPDEEEHANEPD